MFYWMTISCPGCLQRAVWLTTNCSPVTHRKTACLHVTTLRYMKRGKYHHWQGRGGPGYSNCQYICLVRLTLVWILNGMPDEVTNVCLHSSLCICQTSGQFVTSTALFLFLQIKLFTHRDLIKKNNPIFIVSFLNHGFHSQVFLDFLHLGIILKFSVGPFTIQTSWLY